MQFTNVLVKTTIGKKRHFDSQTKMWEDPKNNGVLMVLFLRTPSWINTEPFS